MEKSGGSYIQGLNQKVKYRVVKVQIRPERAANRLVPNQQSSFEFINADNWSK
jgi:hypothetical protein